MARLKHLTVRVTDELNQKIDEFISKAPYRMNKNHAIRVLLIHALQYDEKHPNEIVKSTLFKPWYQE